MVRDVGQEWTARYNSSDGIRYSKLYNHFRLQENTQSTRTLRLAVLGKGAVPVSRDSGTAISPHCFKVKYTAPKWDLGEPARQPALVSKRSLLD